MKTQFVIFARQNSGMSLLSCSVSIVKTEAKYLDSASAFSVFPFVRICVSSSFNAGIPVL